MTRSILDGHFSDRLADVRGRIAILELAEDIGYNLEKQEALKKLRSDESHQVNVMTWARALHNAIMDEAGRQPTTYKVINNRRGEIDQIDYNESPAESWDKLRRHTDLAHRFRLWTKTLVERGQLTAAFVAGLNLVEPVDPAREEEQRRKTEERRKWKIAYDETLAEVAIYGKQQGNSWAVQNARSAWSLGNYPYTEEGVVMWVKRLVERELLPDDIDRFVQNISELRAKFGKLRAKVKGVLA